MDDDDKDTMINRAEQMVKAGRFKTVEEALQFILHKSKRKKDINIFKELYEYCETKGIS